MADQLLRISMDTLADLMHFSDTITGDELIYWRQHGSSFLWDQVIMNRSEAACFSSMDACKEEFQRRVRIALSHARATMICDLDGETDA